MTAGTKSALLSDLFGRRLMFFLVITIPLAANLFINYLCSRGSVFLINSTRIKWFTAVGADHLTSIRIRGASLPVARPSCVMLTAWVGEIFKHKSCAMFMPKVKLLTSLEWNKISARIFDNHCRMDRHFCRNR